MVFYVVFVWYDVYGYCAFTGLGVMQQEPAAAGTYGCDADMVAPDAFGCGYAVIGGADGAVYILPDCIGWCEGEGDVLLSALCELYLFLFRGEAGAGDVACDMVYLAEVLMTVVGVAGGPAVGFLCFGEVLLCALGACP